MDLNHHNNTNKKECTENDDVTLEKNIGVLVDIVLIGNLSADNQDWSAPDSDDTYLDGIIQFEDILVIDNKVAVNDNNSDAYLFQFNFERIKMSSMNVSGNACGNGGCMIIEDASMLMEDMIFDNNIGALLL